MGGQGRGGEEMAGQGRLGREGEGGEGIEGKRGRGRALRGSKVVEVKVKGMRGERRGMG